MTITSSAAPLKGAAATAELGGKAETAFIRDDIRARLDADQTAWLEKRLARPVQRHALDYRVSTGLFGSRFYVSVFAGREGRSDKRIQQEGLKRPFSTVMLEIMTFALALTFMICTVLGFGFGLFWALDQLFNITNLPEYIDKLFH